MESEAPGGSAMELEAVRQAGGAPLARLLGLARSALGSATRLLSRRYISLFMLLGVPTTVLTFLLRTLGSMQAARRRRALADVAGRRRQEARDNIAAVLAETHGSTKSGPQQDVLGLGFLELQKRLKDGKLSAQTVLASYRAQAGRAHARVNCLTEFLPEAGQVAQVAPRAHVAACGRGSRGRPGRALRAPGRARVVPAPARASVWLCRCDRARAAS
jgi:hypothetical protein